MEPSPGATRDGFVEIHGYRLYWRSVGTAPPGRTALVLHGGPGSSLDYLAPFEDLAGRGYRVVFYDQLGCGRSDRARSDSEYSVRRDVEDLDALRTSLGLDRIHLLGSSYGGLLAIAYALDHPEQLRSLVSVSGLASVPLTVAEMHRLRRELPPPFPSILDRFEARGEFSHPEYLAAVDLFYRRHLCRLDPWPVELLRTLEFTNGPKYHVMNGPNEFTIVGTIRDYDITDRLGEIRVPTLVTAGRYDEVTPRVARSIHERVPGSEYAEFANSSHLAFWEERAPYLDRVGEFLDRHST